MRKYALMLIISLAMIVCLLLVFMVLGSVMLIFKVDVLTAGALVAGVTFVMFVFSYAVLTLNGHGQENLGTLLKKK